VRLHGGWAYLQGPTKAELGFVEPILLGQHQAQSRERLGVVRVGRQHIAAQLLRLIQAAILDGPPRLIEPCLATSLPVASVAMRTAFYHEP